MNVNIDSMTELVQERVDMLWNDAEDIINSLNLDDDTLGEVCMKLEEARDKATENIESDIEGCEAWEFSEGDYERRG